MQGEVLSHFSTLKATGECRAREKFRELEPGDEVFVVSKFKVDKITFKADKDGIVTRQHSAKVSDDEMFIITPEEADKAMAKYKEDQTGQLSIVGEMERNGEFGSDDDA